MSRLENSGKIFRDEIVSRNLYIPNDIYDINNPKTIQAINSISRLLRPGNAFDFSNTVIGRVIGPQTPLTEISRRALFNLFSEQVKSTIIRKKAPLINFDNLLRDDRKFISKNIDFSITKEEENNIENKLFSILRYGGVNRLSNPIRYKSIIDVKNYNTTELSKFLVNNTGKGQLQALTDNVNNNIFSNNLSNLLSIDNTEYLTFLINTKSDITFLRNNFDITDNIPILSGIPTDIYFDGHYRRRYRSKFYATENNIIKQSTVINEFGENNIIQKRFKDIDLLNDNDIVTLNNSNDVFTWGKRQTTSIRRSKGILGYTAALFNTLNTKDNAPFNKNVTSIELNGERHYNGIRYGIVDDNGNITENRSYSISNQMDSISKTIKPFGYTDELKKNSPLYKRPIPKVIFDRPDIDQPVNNNVMFSIENLAINPLEYENVPIPEEIGQNGRILWFSPTIIDFNETVSPNINTTNFLGRGEPVYTYANTERKLTLNFYMVVDHADEYVGVRNFFQFQERLYNLRNIEKPKIKIQDTNGQILKIKEDLVTSIKDKKIISVPFEYDDFIDISYYFPNNVSIIDNTYERGVGELNENFDNSIDRMIRKLNQYYQQNPNANFTINVKGFTSALASTEYNKTLSKNRAESLITYIKNYIFSTNKNLLKILNFVAVPLGESEAQQGRFYDTAASINDLSVKQERKVTIFKPIPVVGSEEFEIDLDVSISNDEPNTTTELEKQLDDLTDTQLAQQTVFKNLIDDYDNDIANDKVGSFSKIKENRFQNGLITYTPYELYKRLTFLQQCTRQGLTQENDDNISNAVFGRPPFIIFRLGDMYNTKAIITGLTFDFEDTLPWDLNPEGFGVQKLGCRVSLSMNIIGGSSVDGPKNHIPNAYSRRYYANSRFEAGVNDKLDKEEV
jgi:hypothetical protein